ncbi:hypothetical protein ACLB1Q_17900 [Escherichia coli]
MPFVAEAMEVLGGIGYCEESAAAVALPEYAGSIGGSGKITRLDAPRVPNKRAYTTYCRKHLWK